MVWSLLAVVNFHAGRSRGINAPELCIPETGRTEPGKAESYIIKISFIKDCSTQVCNYIVMLFSPSVPDSHALLENIKMLLISHKTPAPGLPG